MNNALILPKWEGDNSDTSLIGLSHLLQGTVGFFLGGLKIPKRHSPLSLSEISEKICSTKAKPF